MLAPMLQSTTLFEYYSATHALTMEPLEVASTQNLPTWTKELTAVLMMTIVVTRKEIKSGFHLDWLSDSHDGRHLVLWPFLRGVSRQLLAFPRHEANEFMHNPFRTFDARVRLVLAVEQPFATFVILDPLPLPTRRADCSTKTFYLVIRCSPGYETCFATSLHPFLLLIVCRGFLSLKSV